MDALHAHAGLLHVELGIGEIPDSLHAAGHQPFGHGGGGGAGDSENTHAGRMLGEIGLELVDMEDGGGSDGSTHHLGQDVKGCVQMEAAGLELKALDEGAAQISGPQDDRRMPLVHAQNIGDLPQKLVHIITVALLPELPEAGQVLPDLGGRQAHGSAQSAGRDAYHTGLVEIGQMAVIAWKTANNGLRHLVFSQDDHTRFLRGG